MGMFAGRMRPRPLGLCPPPPPIPRVPNRPGSGVGELRPEDTWTVDLTWVSRGVAGRKVRGSRTCPTPLHRPSTRQARSPQGPSSGPVQLRTTGGHGLNRSPPPPRTLWTRDRASRAGRVSSAPFNLTVVLCPQVLAPSVPITPPPPPSLRRREDAAERGEPGPGRDLKSWGPSPVLGGQRCTTNTEKRHWTVAGKPSRRPPPYQVIQGHPPRLGPAHTAAVAPSTTSRWFRGVRHSRGPPNPCSEVSPWPWRPTTLRCSQCSGRVQTQRKQADEDGG